MVYAQSGICPGEWDTLTALGFWDTNGSPNLSQITRPSDSKKKKKKKKKRTCRVVDFAFQTDHRVKLKENEKKDKYLDLARKLKKLCCNLCSRFTKETGRLENKRTNRDHLNYSFIKISLNTQKSSGVLKSLKLQWETHRRMLVWKTLKSKKK